MSEEYTYRLVYNGTSSFDEYIDSPGGWDESGIIFARNEIYHSVLRSAVLSLRFDRRTGGGGEYIKQAYDEAGIYAEVEYYQYRRNPQTNDYDLFYHGISDLKKYIADRDYIECAIIDSSKQEKLLTRDNINYNVRDNVSTDNVSVTDFTFMPTDILFKPIDIYLSVETISRFDLDDFPGDSIWDYTTIGGTPPASMDEKIIPFYLEETTKNEIGDELTISDDPDPDNRTIEIYRNDSDEDITILTGDPLWDILENTMEVTVSTFDPSEVVLDLIADVIDSEDTVITSRLIYRQAFTSGTTTPVYITLALINYFYTTWSVPAGGAFRLYFKYYPTTEIVLISRIDGKLRFNINYTKLSLSIGQTYAECFYPHEAFTRLVQLSTSETDTDKLFYSEILGRPGSEFSSYTNTGEAAYDVVTNGFAIRKYPNRAINVSLRKLFQTFDAIYNLGFGYDRVNDRFYISPKREFYNPDYFMYDLGEIKDLKISIYENGYFNDIKSGYNSDGDYEDLQGAKEINVQTEHSVNPPVKKSIDLRTKYDLDSIGIEITRRKQYSTSAGEDTKRDDNIFIVKTDGLETLQGVTDGDGIENIEQYYNLTLTPRENLIRNGSLIKPALYKTTELIKFVKSKKKVDISYQNQNGQNVNEFDDIEASELTEDALFIPEMHEFEAFVVTEHLTILNENPHGFIKYSFDGVDYQGYIDEVETKDYNRKATYKLIAKPFIEPESNKIYEDDYNDIFEEANNQIFE